MSHKNDKGETDGRLEGEREGADERQSITRDYYSSRPKTFDTMLGGYTQVHDGDIHESRQLLQSLFKVGLVRRSLGVHRVFAPPFSNMPAN
jgi:hypothetical protein